MKPSKKKNSPPPPVPLGEIAPPPVRLSRCLVLAALFGIFGLVYLVAPVWSLPRQPWQQIALAAGTCLLGLAWAWLSSDDIPAWTSYKGWAWLPVSLVLVTAINWPALGADLSWKGDEDHHFKTVAMLARLLTTCGILVAAVLLGVLALAVRDYRRPCASTPRGLRVCMGLLLLWAAAVVATLFWAKPALDMWVLPRYPLIVSWMASVPVFLTRRVTDWAPEASYRIVPLLSGVLLAWCCVRRAGTLGVVGKLFYILALATVPSVLYYSSILYLEMPAIVLMTCVCLDAENLLAAPAGELRKSFCWLPLILIGFVKETAITFLLSFLLCRVIIQLRGALARHKFMPVLFQEIRVAACVLLPFVTYCFYRTQCYDSSRPYSPAPAALLDLASYGVLLRAFWEQFGPFSLLLPVALAILWRQKRTHTMAFLIVAIVAFAAFHVMDLPLVLGLNRFVLMFLPMVLAAAHLVLTQAARWNAKFAVAALAAVVGLNLLLSPMHLDGSRKTGWGEYVLDWSEQSYPYRQAIRYVQEKYPRDRTLLTGMPYQYWQQFYTGETDQFVRQPVATQLYSIEELGVIRQLTENQPGVAQWGLQQARGRGFQHVIFHVLGSTAPQPAQTYGFVQEKVFRNAEHCLVLFSLH